FGWTFLALGTSFIGLLLAGVVMYMILTIKAINLGTRQSNFIDSVTHELKSPIASMKLYLQTMLRHPVSEDKRDGFCTLMLEDVDRLNHLINQMLDAGRLEAGRAFGKAEDVSLPEVVAECADITRKRNRVPAESFRLELEPCRVRAAPAQLSMVFRNILDNAVKYAGVPPRVEVTVGPLDERRAVVRIADNGSGIPPGARRKIFRRFVRLGSELEREQPGTGLGLYVSKTIVRRMSGRIRVKDRAVGTGAVFEVVLPRLATTNGEA
ncbi:MAG: HAMP domain-containing sensor histidine kinase, partial [Planctomycetota bacterium]